MSQAASIADQITKTAKGFRAGTVLLWGYPPVRPDDDVFQIASATAKGGVLELRFEKKGEGSPLPGQVLEVHEPEGFSSKKGTLQIKSAKRVRWGSVEGEPKPGAPALELRPAIV